MNEADRDLLYLVAIAVFFPASIVFLVARWIIRRAKRHTWALREVG